VEWPPHDGHQKGLWIDERGDLLFRTRVAMLGSFGISAPVGRWSADELRVVGEHVAWYKERVRPLVHHGDQYLLTEAPTVDGDGSWAVAAHVSKEGHRAAVFAFRLQGASRLEVPVPGLDPDATYRVVGMDRDPTYLRGADLGRGLSLTIDAPYRSAMLSLERGGGARNR
jgi:alpha-galactosidase